MSNMILTAVLVLGIIGLILGVVLFVVAKKFSVEEDPRIGKVIELLPGANCGGCGFPGCAAFAEACVKRGSLKGLKCSVNTKENTQRIAELLGAVSEPHTDMIAVVRCNGSCENRPRQNIYDGANRCSIAHMMTGGDTGCSYGCLGCGDCVTACKFDAIHMNAVTGLPDVDQEKCTACGMCVSACPRSIIELRNKNKLNRRVYVSCVNKDKGPIAKQACAIACIGCGKCVKVCEFDAIKQENNLAYIDYEKCRLCRKCVDVCPQNTIWAVNFPPKKGVVQNEDKATVMENVTVDKNNN